MSHHRAKKIRKAFKLNGHNLERIAPAYKMAKRMSRPTERVKQIETNEGEKSE